MIATSTALALAGIGAAVAGGASLGAAGIQAHSANKSRKAAAQAGQQAIGELRGAFEPSLSELQQGYAGARGYFDQAQQLYGAGLDPTRQFYEQQQSAGQGALQQLQNAILGGPQAGANFLSNDPGYAFRQQQGELGIQRAMAASGQLGSGSNFKDFARFNQGLASQEYGNALNRLMGLYNIGSQGAAGLQGLASAQANLYGRQGALAVQQGQDVSGLRSNYAANMANAITGNAATQAQFSTAGSNAWAQGLAGVGNSVQNGIGNLLFLDALSGSPASTTGLSPYRGLSAGMMPTPIPPSGPWR